MRKRDGARRGKSRTAAWKAKRRGAGSAGLAPTSLRPHGVHRSERFERGREVSCPAGFIGKWWRKEAPGCGLFTRRATGGAGGRSFVCFGWWSASMVVAPVERMPFVEPVRKWQ